jgi:hypothetical protein
MSSDGVSRIYLYWLNILEPGFRIVLMLDFELVGHLINVDLKDTIVLNIQ